MEIWNLHLNVLYSNISARGPWSCVVRCCYESCDDEENRCEEAKGVLRANDGGMHIGVVPLDKGIDCFKLRIFKP